MTALKTLPLVLILIALSACGTKDQGKDSPSQANRSPEEVLSTTLTKRRWEQVNPKIPDGADLGAEMAARWWMEFYPNGRAVVHAGHERPRVIVGQWTLRGATVILTWDPDMHEEYWRSVGPITNEIGYEDKQLIVRRWGPIARFEKGVVFIQR